MKVYAGEFKKIYDPSEGMNEKWYINDHTLFPGKDGWHLFGITHEEPADPLNEKLCAHAITEDILNVNLKKLDPPMVADAEYQELHFWAPHIIEHEGVYHMFYCAGSLESHEKYRIHQATSTDLYNWTRCPENPMVIDGFDARDPMVVRMENEWVMYYTCNSAPEGGNHCVACVKSDDLVHWHDKQVVFTSSIVGTFGGPCESPFVEKVGDMYYLFIGPFGGYDVAYVDTAVYASSDPFHFSEDQLVGHIASHAAEIIHVDGKPYITHCGWGEGGVYIAPLYFE